MIVGGWLTGLARVVHLLPALALLVALALHAWLGRRARIGEDDLRRALVLVGSVVGARLSIAAGTV